MTAHTPVGIARAEVVGSLLRPGYLREARQALREGRADASALRAAEDRAVLEAIALQESAGLDVISDGEMRRASWIATIPLREEDPAFRPPVSGYEFFSNLGPGWIRGWRDSAGRPVQRPGQRAAVTRKLRVERDIVAEEYRVVKAHARRRSRYTLPAPSYHRVF